MRLVHASRTLDTEVAEVYNVSYQTIKRWRGLGIQAGFPAPFEDPVKMLDWWDTLRGLGFHKQSFPLVLKMAADKHLEQNPVDPDAPQPDGKPLTVPHIPGSNPEMEKLLADIESGDKFDYGDGVKIAQRNVKVCDLLLIQAIKAGRMREIGPLRKQLSDAGDAYRALMKDRGKIQAEAGETLPKGEVRQAMIEIHGNITKRFRQSLKLAYPQLEENAATPEDWAKYIDGLVDSICRSLKDSTFAAE